MVSMLTIKNDSDLYRVDNLKTNVAEPFFTNHKQVDNSDCWSVTETLVDHAI